MLQPKDITEYFINKCITSGDRVIDATAGNGNDTLKLCNAVGKSGKVFAFDIQQLAIDETTKRLTEQGIKNALMILDSHSELDKYVTQPVKAVLFNLGYLPGGDHCLQTKYDTTIAAIEKSLKLLTDDGFISVTIYYGKNSGTEEKENVLKYLNTLDHKKYTVMLFDFYNRPNNPPITAIITPNIK